VRTLRQIGAIARTEVRFGLRRGWPVVGVAVAGLAVSGATIWLAAENTEGLALSRVAERSAKALADIWPAFPFLVLGILPMVSAPAIPLDRQLGVDELLKSLPLASGTYLAGKVLGTVAAALLAGAATLVLHVVLHLALVGPLLVEVYALLTLFSALPLLTWAAAMGVLIASGLRSRRGAILLGLLVGMVSLFAWGFAVMRPPYSSDQGYYVERTGSLVRDPVLDLVLQKHGLLPSYAPPPTSERPLYMIGAALLVLAVTSALALLRLGAEGET